MDNASLLQTLLSDQVETRYELISCCRRVLCFTVIFVSKLAAMGWGRKEWMRLLGHCCHVMCYGIVKRGPQPDQFPAVATQKSEKLNTVG